MNRNENTKDVVITLYEGHFHLGVAALVNSLVASKFVGTIVVGYKGNLPNWVNQLQKQDNYYKLSPDIELSFRLLEIDMHLGYYKPHFMMDVLNGDLAIEKIYYFDPDIVVNAPWQFYSNWVKNGVALCLDVCFSYLHYSHPWRKEWKALWSEPFVENKDINFYVNSGFFGIERNNTKLIENWIKITNTYKAIGKSVNVFGQSTAHNAIKSDQDLLNAALTVTNNVDLSIIGTEGMGFTFPAYVMSHALGGNAKAWKKKYVLSLIKDKKPSMAETDFFKHINQPIKVFSSTTAFLKKADLKLAKILGRLIGN